MVAKVNVLINHQLSEFYLPNFNKLTIFAGYVIIEYNHNFEWRFAIENFYDIDVGDFDYGSRERD